MRYIILILLFISKACFGQIAFVSSAGAGSSTGNTITTTTTTVGASLIVVGIQYFPNSGGTNLPVLTDNQGNTWTLGKRSTSSNFQATDAYYCYPCIVNAAQTLSATCTACFPSISLLSFSATLVSLTPFDQVNGATTISNVSTFNPGSITPSQNNELVITSIVSSSSSVGTVPTGYTYGFTIGGNSNHFGGGLAYQIQSSATATNPTWNISPANSVAATILSFKAAPVSNKNRFFIMINP